MASPIIVVGAGLAGLVAARELQRRGLPVLVLDAADRPGGRLKTDVVEGYRLDRGFQVLFTAYPAARQLLDYGKLDLQRFAPGALVSDHGELHDIDGDTPLKTAMDGFLSIADKLKVLNLTWECRGMSSEQIWRLPDMPTYRHLRQLGFSNEFIERFARPFFGGIFLDRSLNVSRQMFTFVWKMLSEGDTVVPAEGIEAIPRQLATGLPLRMNARVKSLVGERRVKGVVLDSGEVLDAQAVIWATDGPALAAATGYETPTAAKSQICLYFSAPEPPTEQPKIILRTGEGLVNVVVPVSMVNPHVGGEDALVSVTINGDHPAADDELAAMVKSDAAALLPGLGVESWRLLKAYRIPFAQFAQPPYFRRHLAANTPGRDGLYVAGEITEHSSIQGALASGYETARLAIEDLCGVRA